MNGGTASSGKCARRSILKESQPCQTFRHVPVVAQELRKVYSVVRSAFFNVPTAYVTTVISAQAVTTRGIVRSAALKMPSRRAKSISQETQDGRDKKRGTISK